MNYDVKKGIIVFLKITAAYFILHFTLFWEMATRAIIGLIILYYFNIEFSTLEPKAIGGLAVVIFVWILLPLWWQFGVNGFNKWAREVLKND